VRDLAEIAAVEASRDTPKSLVDVDNEQIYCDACGYRKRIYFDFDQNLYRQRYIDWIIRHNIAFYTATHPDILILL
jgi:hypothetical protein